MSDREIKIKEPTLGAMVKIAHMIIENPIEAIYGEKLIDVLELVTNANREEIETLNPDKAHRLLADFFTLWKPNEWISGNTEIISSYQKSLRRQPKDSPTTKKPLNPE